MIDFGQSALLSISNRFQWVLGDSTWALGEFYLGHSNGKEKLKFWVFSPEKPPNACVQGFGAQTLIRAKYQTQYESNWKFVEPNDIPAPIHTKLL